MTDHPTQCKHCGLPVPAGRRLSSADSQAASFCCYGCRVAFSIASAGSDASVGPVNTLLLRLGFGIVVTLNIMVFNWLFLWQHVFDPSLVHDPAAALAPVSAWASYLLLFLCTLVIATLGLPMAADLIANFRYNPRLDVNMLILLGVFAAYILSAINTFRGEPTLYYDTAALILVLVTLGHYLDSRTKLAATQATRTLLESLPGKVFIKRNNEYLEVDLSNVLPGDILRIRPGETAAADGTILTGHGHIAEAHLTGESIPRPASAGDVIFAGSTAVDTQFTVTVENVGDNLLISQMQRMLEEARLRQPVIQRIADRVAAVFIPLVIVLAASVFAVNAIMGNPVEGLLHALAVLLISCPCALGLAAPLATWSAIGRAARRGILIDAGPTLEKAAHLRKIFIDKTGTLTANNLELEKVNIYADDYDEKQVMAIAGAIGQTSTHPVSKAIAWAAETYRFDIPDLTDIENHPGLGVSATIHGTRFHLCRTHIGDRPNDHDQTTDPSAITVYLSTDDQTIACLQLGEQLRPDAKATIDQLKAMKIEVEILTGDRPQPAQRVAEQLKVPVHSQLLPADKQQFVENWRSKHADKRHTVAMVGDGINDSPTLAAADVGFAVGSATDLAKQAGHIHLASDRLEHVALTVAIARHAMRRIYLNLAWAFSYNTIGLVLAAAGLLNPVFAAIAMLCSSLLIVLTSRNAGDTGYPLGTNASDLKLNANDRLPDHANLLLNSTP